MYWPVYISSNDLPEFPFAALSSIDVATATPHSSALQDENSFFVIWLKVNRPVHWRMYKEKGGFSVFLLIDSLYTDWYNRHMEYSEFRV